MKLAIVHHAAPPVVGGVERVLGEHARLFADAGHDVSVVAGRGGSQDARVAFVGLPLVDSRHPDVLAVGNELRAGRVTGAFERLRVRIAGELRPILLRMDVVFCHNVCSLANNLALTTALRDLVDEETGPRFVLWHHDLAWSRSRSGLHAGRPWDLLRSPWPGTISVVVSEARRRELTRLTGLCDEDVRVIPNGVDVTGLLRISEATLALARMTGILDADPLLILSARVLPRKNVELAIRTVAALRHSGRPAGLVVTGPVDPHHPSTRAYLQQLLDLRLGLGLVDAVWFPGVDSDAGLPDAVVADLHALADASLLLSREEGFGLPVLEALLHRLPLVCSDLPALRAVAGHAAVYVDPDADPGEIARLLVRLLDEPVAQARRRVRRESSWQSVWRQHLAPLLDDLAS